ncbi:hypothetical protein K7X08_006176 [Anisodus acutangulus]|uniref:Uncharacterized protein n=1 Tax=Anisodus acutangulus TaxID=402998 RepID=A0A9Q1MUU3_9SOLA|nr:hypothetical protein K7X08_006176 [Anisodus acutangulus]
MAGATASLGSLESDDMKRGEVAEEYGGALWKALTEPTRVGVAKNGKSINCYCPFFTKRYRRTTPKVKSSGGVKSSSPKSIRLPLHKITVLRDFEGQHDLSSLDDQGATWMLARE